MRAPAGKEAGAANELRTRPGGGEGVGSSGQRRHAQSQKCASTRTVRFTLRGLSAPTHVHGTITGRGRMRRERTSANVLEQASLHAAAVDELIDEPMMTAANMADAILTALKRAIMGCDNFMKWSRSCCCWQVPNHERIIV